MALQRFSFLNRIFFRSLAVAAVSSVLPIDASGQAPSVIEGAWEGRYNCAQGPTGFAVDVSGSKGRLRFFPVPENPGVPEGEYEIEIVQSNHTVELRPVRWIKQPPGYSLATMRGARAPGSKRVSGLVEAGGCADFVLTKVEKNDQSAQVAPHGAPDIAPAQPTAPVQKIQTIYSQLASDVMGREDNPALNPDRGRAFFSPEFHALWISDQQCWDQDGAEGAAQMWVSGQDWTITDVQVRVVASTADTQSVLAEFKNFGQYQAWTYVFRSRGNDWLVEDVLADGKSLSAAMKGGCVRYDSMAKSDPPQGIAPGEMAPVTPPEIGDGSENQVAEIPPVPAPAAGTPPEAFKRCIGCHPSSKPSGFYSPFGPPLLGVVGRRAGSTGVKSAIQYLRVAREQGIIWDENSLTALLSGSPPFSKVAPHFVRNPKDIREIDPVAIREIVDFLKTQ